MPKVYVCKYKETPIFHFHNANPKGKNAGDCVARAISVALNQSWEQTIREMTELGIREGLTFNEDRLIKKYLYDKGWIQMKEPRDCNNKKITVKEFIELRTNKEGTIIIKPGSHHVSLIKDGVVWDTWDCTRKTMHIYWVKPRRD